nr:tetratricopeptide repeat protein [cf. Phormidesmis sp. LEGE 11477]
MFAGGMDVADRNYDYIVTYPYAAAYNALGNSLRAQGKVTEAEAAYQKALTYVPDYRFAHYNLGKLYYQMGRSDDSEQSYRKATYNYDRHIEPNVYNPFSYGGLGYILQSQGRWDLALAYYRSALDYRADDLFAQNNLAETLRLRTLATQPPPTIEEEKRWLPEAEPGSRHRELPYRSVVRVVTPLALGTSYTVGTVVKRESDRVWILTTRSAITQLIPTGSEDTDYINDSIEVEFFSDPPVGQVRLRREAEVWRYAELREDLDLAVLVIDDAPPDVQPIAISATAAEYREERSPEYIILGHQEAPWSFTRSKIDQVISPTTDWPIPGSLVIVNEDIGSRNLGSPMIGRIGGSGDRDQILGLVFPPSDDGGHTYVHPAPAIRAELFRWGLLALTD